MITLEQIKDLRPLQIGEKFEIGGVFYKKEGNQFSTCIISEFELKEEDKAHILRLMTKKFIEDQVLFIRINAPFKSFQ